MRRVASSDGVEVAVHDLGGRGAPLLLVHATGFCGPVFAPLASHLGSRFHCWAVDVRGHGRAAAPDGATYAWSGLADDVLAAAGALGPAAGGVGGGVAAVGHSSGGAAVLLAEAERPGTFSALWCYEPIVWPDPAGARGRAERLAEGARRRRDRFPSRDDAYANFAAKPPFSALSPAALQAYVEHGFGDEGEGSVRLRCPPAVEAAIYLGAVEGDRFGRLAEVRCPVVVACGGRTDAIRPALARQLAEALPSGRLRVFDGLGHFGPLEDPRAVAEAVLADLG